MVLGLTDGQSLTAFIADPMICSHVILDVCYMAHSALCVSLRTILVGQFFSTTVPKIQEQEERCRVQISDRGRERVNNS